MKTHTITLDIQFTEELYNELHKAFSILDEGGCYNDNFDDFIHDVTDFRITKHIAENMALMLDLDKHFCKLIQT